MSLDLDVVVTGKGNEQLKFDMPKTSSEDVLKDKWKFTQTCLA